jgi:hypothetical protein
MRSEYSKGETTWIFKPRYVYYESKFIYNGPSIIWTGLDLTV